MQIEMLRKIGKEMYLQGHLFLKNYWTLLMDRLDIEPYHSKYQSDFEILNREWIEEYFKMEQEDLNILQNPEEYVIKKGGEVFFALLDGRVVGTAAAVPTTLPSRRAKKTSPPFLITYSSGFCRIFKSSCSILKYSSIHSLLRISKSD